jgi:hypothetical protein
LFIPTDANRLSWLLAAIRYIHDRMLELGICVRGAVTIGAMYWDKSWGARPSELHAGLIAGQFRKFGQVPPDLSSPTDDPAVAYDAKALGFPITLGPGLVEAYGLESNRAKHPRVIASESLREYLKHHGDESSTSLTSPTPADSLIPISTFFRTDGDGEVFFDVLHPSIDRNDTERITHKLDHNNLRILEWERRDRTHDQILTLASEVAGVQMAKSLPEKVRESYEWLQGYVTCTRGS